MPRKKETEAERERRAVEEEIARTKLLLRKQAYYYVYEVFFFALALGSYYAVSWILESPISDTLARDAALHTVAEGLKTGLAWMLLVMGILHTLFMGLAIFKFMLEHHGVAPRLRDWFRKIGKRK